MVEMKFKDLFETDELEDLIAALEELRDEKLREEKSTDIDAYRQQIQKNPNALYANYHTDEEFQHIEVPHCPTCDKRLVRYSFVVHDNVWDTVNYCKNCGQMIKWNFYNDNV